MELKWLEDFLSLASTRSFSRSAEERNITQPAFSRRIKALELWLGAPLVDRSTYPTTLTPTGRMFRETAEEVLRTLHEARDDVRGRTREAQAMLSFAALHTLTLSFFPPWLRTVEAELGSLHTRIMAESMHNCVQALAEGDCDFLLCFTHPSIPVLLNPSRFPSLKLDTDRLMPTSLADAAGRPLFTLPGTPSAPLPYLSYTPTTFLGRAVEQLLQLRAEPRHLQRHYENSMADSLKAMVLEGHGLAWLPESSIRHELRQGRLVPAGDRSWAIAIDIRIFRSKETSRPRVEEFWSFLSRTTQGG